MSTVPPSSAALRGARSRSDGDDALLACRPVAIDLSLLVAASLPGLPIDGGLLLQPTLGLSAQTGRLLMAAHQHSTCSTRVCCQYQPACMAGRHVSANGVKIAPVKSLKAELLLSQAEDSPA